MQLNEIENEIFEGLKAMSCPTLKNACNIESTISLKEILINQSYLEEKLNLLIWIIFKFEPKFASDFIDSEFFSIGIKGKKIIDALHTLGIIDLNEFTIEKLLNSNIKYYKEILLVLYDLYSLLQNRLNSQVLTLDEIFSNEIMGINYDQTKIISDDQYCSHDDLIFRKIKFIHDVEFLKEFRNIVQSGLTSLIPSDLSRLIKNLSEKCLFDFQINKASKKEILDHMQKEICFLEDQLKSNEESETSKKFLNLNSQDEEFNRKSIGYKDDLVKIEKLIGEFNEFINELSKQEIVSNKNTCNTSKNQMQFLDSDFGISSNLGKNFSDCRSSTQIFENNCKKVTDWAKFFHKQQLKQKEYSNCCLVDKNNYESIINDTNKLENELNEYLSLLGHENQNETDKNNVDKLLLL